MHLHFRDLAGPVAFLDARPVMEALRKLLPGWPLEAVPAAASSASPMVSVRRCGPDYVISVPWREEAYAEPSVVGALSTLIVDLVEAYVRSGRKRMCLHCAAVEIGDRLVVFPAASRAGKSTLTAAFAAAGQRVFTDDLLAFNPETGDGRAFGFPPRLRLPLPPRLDPFLADFLTRHAGPSDSDYRYLTLPADLQAAFGSTARLGAVVLLERDEDQRQPRFATVDAGRVMRLLIGQSVSAAGLSPNLLDAFHELISRTPCLVLRYSDLGPAVRLLLEELPGETAAASAEPSSIQVRARTAGSGREEPGRLFQQTAGAYAKAVDDRLFLADEADGTVYELDLIGAGIWNLLAEPVAAEEAVQILAELFPEVEAARIEADVVRLLRDLEREGLIRRL